MASSVLIPSFSEPDLIIGIYKFEGSRCYQVPLKMLELHTMTKENHEPSDTADV